MEKEQEEHQGDSSRPRRETTITDFKEFHSTGRRGKVAEAIQKIETPDKDREETQKQQQTKGKPRNPTARRNLSGEPQHSHSQEEPTPGSNTRKESSEPGLDCITEAVTPKQSPRMAEVDQLKEELKQLREQNEQIKTDLEAARLRNEVQAEKIKQKEWQAAKDKLDQEHAQAAKREEQELADLKANDGEKEDKSIIKQLQDRIAQLEAAARPPEDTKREAHQQEVADQLKQLMAQQAEITEKAKAAAKGCEDTPAIQELLQQLNKEQQPPTARDDQSKLMENLLNTLQGKQVESNITRQKDILRQFLVDSNKVTTTGGATTLKPDLLKKLTGESDSFNMTEWLANFNRRTSEEGKCDSCQEECKHHKKSGMLEKATANIQHKEIWPQKNLLEDWADEELEFKHMMFEHYVAGEARTIETSTEPAQILGRLRLLRKLAYAKLRGYEWPLIRKMYAAILRSIETKENTWESNFDRYETILYRRAPIKREDKPGQTSSNSKKWFCRDWNKGNCQKSSPHKAWFGTGTNAVQRTVLHICATCYMKEKAQRDHPEGQETCPHKEA